MKARTSGVLLPIPCLPSRFGIGDLGPIAYKFADILAEAKQHVWQILPLNPTFSENGHSPYESTSAFAFNPLLISPEFMIRDGFLEKKDLKSIPKFQKDSIDYKSVLQIKTKLLNKAFEVFRQNGPDHDFRRFCTQNAWWLKDFALFEVFKKHFDKKSWNQWPRKIRDRVPDELDKISAKLSDEIDYIKFLQYLFFSQWMQLKTYCNKINVHIFGDIPIYVPYDSADTWSNPELFKLDKKNKPLMVSGVPPDYYTETGQLWGHPVYRWEMHKKRRYDWWINRIAYNLKLFDYIRIDHFLGLVSYWEVPADEKTAVNGKWREAPAEDLFDEIMRRFPSLPVIAEDLGDNITADVREIMNKYDFPGMKLLVFGFMNDQPDNPHSPHKIVQNSVVYTGTHDTNTVKGWFEEEVNKTDKELLFRYLGRRYTSAQISWELIRLCIVFSCLYGNHPYSGYFISGFKSQIQSAGKRKGKLDMAAFKTANEFRTYG